MATDEQGLKQCDSQTQQGSVVREIKGQLVLDDPEALAVIRAVNKCNCQNTLKLNAERIGYFKQRIVELGLPAKQAVIIILNVNDVHGGQITEILMPGHDWQEYRDRGEIPFARGIAERDGISELIGFFDKEAEAELSSMTDVAIVVVDHGVAKVFPA
jgi:hypothetical protein